VKWMECPAVRGSALVLGRKVERGVLGRIRTREKVLKVAGGFASRGVSPPKLTGKGQSLKVTKKT